MADYEDNNGRYEGKQDDRAYARDRSASPRNAHGDRDRSRSPNARPDDRAPPVDARMKDIQDEEEGAVNTGTNLFVTGIHPRLSEGDVSRLFEKYGVVENCSIMKDPHTQESRGFGFVNMESGSQADAAKEGLQGEVIEGRTLSIEKARRGRPRTPTPGKYFGPPKRGDFRSRGGRFDRYEDRRGGFGGRRYDDGGYRGGSRYDYYDRRDYGAPRRDREDYASRGIDRYASSRDDRYGSRGDDRRGGGSGGGRYGRSDDRGGYTREEPREFHGSGGRDYDGRDDRYSRDDRYGR